MVDVRGVGLHRAGWWVIAGLLVVTACAGPPPDRASLDDGTAAVAADTDGVAVAPDFELPDLGGESFRLSETEGRVRLIDFWATWCPPCREEIPMLNELQRSYEADGLTILAISDEKPDIVRKFVEGIEVDYTNLLDSGEVTQQYRVMGLPTAFLLDREGRIVETFFGPKPRKALEEQIRELLELPPAT